MGAVVLSGVSPSAAPRPRNVLGRAAMGLVWTVWCASAAVTLGTLVQPVGAAAQLALCGAAGAGMVGVWLVCPKRGLPRMAFLALGSLVVLRYVYWRLSGTLPGLEDPVSFGLGLVLVAAELYCVLILTVSLIINADPLERATVPVQTDAALPSVDIFIPTYNESVEILSLTLAAALNLDYPADKVTVWLLDDGGTDQKCADADLAKSASAKARRTELQALSRALGARYLTRAKNEHAKAGNLNGGLKASRAEIVLVLDADHAPFRSFLRETVGLFAADPKLFLVQTPHVFLNPDPIERNLRTFSAMPSENEMFYAITQRGLDKWNGSFFCGSAALLRREALDAVGGFSGITITEDCETAFELHARGWTSAFVDKPLIAGLQPETFADFIGQRARWCQGMFQIMILKNPLTKAGLKPIQRVGYLSSMAYWFFPLPRLIFMLAPLLHIFFDVKIFVSSIDEALAYTATYIVANMMIQNYLYGRVRWPWISELYEYVQGVYLARSIVSVLISPRKPSFNVTNKGVSLEHDHLSPLAWPFFAIFGALAAGCATATWRYLYEPGVTSLMLVVGLWCLFNLVIAGVALGVVAERRQPERCPSLPVSRGGTVSIGGQSFAVAIRRVSLDGCTLGRVDGLPWPEAAVGTGTLTLQARPDGMGFDALSFRPRNAAEGETCAVAFEGMTSGAYRALADLMYGDAAPLREFLQGRRRHQNLLAGSLRFLAWGVSEPVRAFGYAARALRSGKVGAVAEPMAVLVIAEPLARLPAAEIEVVARIAPAVEATVPLERNVFRLTPGTAWREIAPVPVSEAPTIVVVGPVAVTAPMTVEAPAIVAADPVAVPSPPTAPMTAAAWHSAMRALLGETPQATGAHVTGLDPTAWSACIRALAAAEQAEGKPVFQETSVSPFEAPSAPQIHAERRDPLSRGSLIRNAA